MLLILQLILDRFDIASGVETISLKSKVIFGFQKMSQQIFYVSSPVFKQAGFPLKYEENDLKT